MLVLTIVAVLALLFAVLGMTLNFGEHCQTKFGFKPMAAGTLCLWQLYAILFYGGWMWMANAAQAHGDILNGMLVAGAGLFGACWLVVNNYRRTNLAYAAITTALQIALAVICLPPLSLGLLIGEHNANRDPSGTQRQRRDDNKAGLSGYRPQG